MVASVIAFSDSIAICSRLKYDALESSSAFFSSAAFAFIKAMVLSKLSPFKDFSSSSAAIFVLSLSSSIFWKSTPAFSLSFNSSSLRLTVPLNAIVSSVSIFAIAVLALAILATCIVFSLSSISCCKSNSTLVVSNPTAANCFALALIASFFLLAKSSSTCSRLISSAVVSLFSALSKLMRLVIAASCACTRLVSASINLATLSSDFFGSSMPINFLAESTTLLTPSANDSRPGMAL